MGGAVCEAWRSSPWGLSGKRSCRGSRGAVETQNQGSGCCGSCGFGIESLGGPISASRMLATCRHTCFTVLPCPGSGSWSSLFVPVCPSCPEGEVPVSPGSAFHSP